MDERDRRLNLREIGVTALGWARYGNSLVLKGVVTTRAGIVMRVLAIDADRDGASVFTSRRRLQQLLGFRSAAIAPLLQELVEVGLLELIAMGRGRRGSEYSLTVTTSILDQLAVPHPEPLRVEGTHPSAVPSVTAAVPPKTAAAPLRYQTSRTSGNQGVQRATSLEPPPPPPVFVAGCDRRADREVNALGLLAARGRLNGVDNQTTGNRPATEVSRPSHEQGGR